MSGNDEWKSERPKEEGRGYDGPAGMDPDGVIDSNWEEVGLVLLVQLKYLHFFTRFVRTSMT